MVIRPLARTVEGVTLITHFGRVAIVTAPQNHTASSAELSAQPWLSPSLRANGAHSAYELKFLLPATRAAELLDAAQRHMTLDPHAQGEHGNAYEVHGLYFETPEWHVYRREGSHALQKLRLRRYGAASRVFLEHKAKSGGRVCKRRTLIDEVELEHLAASRVKSDWSGYWFRRRLRARKLQPICAVSYWRTALTGSHNGDSFRLTMDRDLRCQRATDMRVQEVATPPRLLRDDVIVEMKYCDTLPGLFKRLMTDLQLTPTGVSKYRRSVEHCGLVPPELLRDLSCDRDSPPVNRSA